MYIRIYFDFLNSLSKFFKQKKYKIWNFLKFSEKIEIEKWILFLKIIKMVLFHLKINLNFIQIWFIVNVTKIISIPPN